MAGPGTDARPLEVYPGTVEVKRLVRGEQADRARDPVHLRLERRLPNVTGPGRAVDDQDVVGLARPEPGLVRLIPGSPG